ncbi:MAG: HupE/UreJ family protein [Flammeovirgaceae bacterium]|nr:HupE/UreJ family protein [Flammeovirgaceae bacterium]NQW27271.1 HupE/UreJ family protein [Flammeovirgaceae bacterium]
MTEFIIYFELGLYHILDFAGYDHMLFVVAISALYLASDWRKILILVTAFTFGHSITLAMATFDLVNVDSDLIEFLIPLTILITAGSNLFTRDRNRYIPSTRKVSLNYLYAGFFGTIHGFGFSNYLKAILGRDTAIIKQLLAFNLGLEVGQIVVMIFFLIISAFFVGLFGVDRRDWKIIISSIIIGITFVLMIEARFWI